MFWWKARLKTWRCLKAVHERTRGKITATDDNWKPLLLRLKQSKVRWLATSTNQLPERSYVCEPAYKHALGGFLVLMDLHGLVSGESRSPSSDKEHSVLYAQNWQQLDALLKNPVALKVMVWSRGSLSPSRSSLVLTFPWWRRLTALWANVSPFP